MSRLLTVRAGVALCVAAALAPFFARAEGEYSGDAADCRLCAVAQLVERGRIEQVVRGLSGADSVTVAGERRLIRTRSTLHPGKDIAREYLFELALELGYQPERRWFPLRVSFPDVRAAAPGPGWDTLWAGTNEGQILRLTSDDDWRSVTPAGSVGARVFDLRFDHDGVLWAAGKTFAAGFGELHYSRDRGATWIPLVVGGPFNPVYSLSSITFAGPETAFAAGDLGTLVRLWRHEGVWYPALADPAVFMYRNMNGTAASGPLRFWVVADGGALFESSDAGGSWQTRTLTAQRLSDIDFFDAARGVIAGENVTFHTADSGRTWSEVRVPASLLAVAMLDSLTVIAAGRDGTILRSSDGGAAWESIGPVCGRTKDIMRLIAERGRRRAWALGRNELLRFDPDDAGDGCATTSLADTIMGANIVFSRAGLDESGPAVVLCAHYDAVNIDDPSRAPGADDNASGTAAVLEAARVLRGVTLERTIEFIFFDGEEIGLLGSRHHVAQLPAGGGPLAVINLDMIGRDYGSGSRVEIAGRVDGPDTTLVAMIGNTIEFLELALDWNFLVDRSPTSDHKAFWVLEGVPAVLMIEGEYWNNPHYHRGSDVADHIDFDYVTEIARAALASAARLAGLIAVEPPPSAVALHQNFPNPMWSHTRIRFELPRHGPVALAVFDVAGRRVASLIGGAAAGPGRVEYVWDGSDDRGRKLASGIYFLRLEASGAVLTRKIVVLH